ncbi:hypothetical protein MAR_017212 [Mya arenaria]|uniref:Uncharacterized protein n=1 Tax=Mya arenaria TaxID=6604 RepID=A0ABY7EDS9_MYAAR|nr:hypothetical protein MAR_017212 [Mya arenaria]
MSDLENVSSERPIHRREPTTGQRANQQSDSDRQSDGVPTVGQRANSRTVRYPKAGQYANQQSDSALTNVRTAGCPASLTNGRTGLISVLQTLFFTPAACTTARAQIRQHGLFPTVETTFVHPISDNTELIITRNSNCISNIFGVNQLLLERAAPRHATWLHSLTILRIASIVVVYVDGVAILHRRCWDLKVE